MPTVDAYAAEVLALFRSHGFDDEFLLVRFLPPHEEADPWFEKAQIRRYGCVRYPPALVKSVLRKLMIH